MIPKEAHEAAKAKYADYSRRLFCMLMKLLGGKKVLRKNLRDPVSGVGGDFYYVNGISVAQGPNYGKRLRICSKYPTWIVGDLCDFFPFGVFRLYIVVIHKQQLI